ncbi:hypothetical protein CIG19_14110 [Enterobacterales bacterium CwR94]|nr:hypothetical protein CIG19_14110 [Enterobacterales bacterium CwR94]
MLHSKPSGRMVTGAVREAVILRFIATARSISQWNRRANCAQTTGIRIVYNVDTGWIEINKAVIF